MSDKNLKEYIVTLHSYEHLDSFYEDMETPGGNLYIPDRAVDLVNRRPISRNTHYLLTEEEARLIRQDPRVLDVDIPVDHNPLTVRSYSWSQTNTFSPQLPPSTTDKNWGLLYSTSETINSSLDSFSSVSATVTRPFSGKNVDLVMAESTIKKNHAEFAKNADGTGGYRTIETNWYGYGLGSPPTVTPQETSPYNYSYVGFHATHTAGTAAGNTQGWAKDCNIHFNVPIYAGSFPNYQGPWDYIRTWHSWKKVNAINPNTGIHNPTVVSLSTNVRTKLFTFGLGTIHYRGVSYPGPWARNPSRTDRDNPGAWTNGTVSLADVGFREVRSDDNILWYVFAGQSMVAENADLTDAINDGVIIVQSAGNHSSKVVRPGDPDYNNYVIALDDGKTYYQNRNEWTADVIAVGNHTAARRLGYTTDTGPAITIWAPGTNIISSISDSAERNEFSDPRGLNNDKLLSISGTSMAAPQVGGVLACLAELWPSATQSQMKNFILTHARSRMTSSAFTIFPNTLSYRDSDTTDKTLYYPNFSFSVSPNKSSVSSDEIVVINITGSIDSPLTWESWSAKYNIPQDEGQLVAAALYTNNNLLGNYGPSSTPFYGLHILHT